MAYSGAFLRVTAGYEARKAQQHCFVFSPCGGHLYLHPPATPMTGASSRFHLHYRPTRGPQKTWKFIFDCNSVKY